MLVPPNILSSVAKALKTLFQDNKASERVKDDNARLDPQATAPQLQPAQTYFAREPQNQGPQPLIVRDFGQQSSDLSSAVGQAFSGASKNLGGYFSSASETLGSQLSAASSSIGLNSVFPGVSTIRPPTPQSSTAASPDQAVGQPAYNPAYDVPARPPVTPVTLNTGTADKQLLLPDLLQEQVPVHAPRSVSPYSTAYDVPARPYNSAYDVPGKPGKDPVVYVTPEKPGKDPEVSFSGPKWLTSASPDYVPPSEKPYYLRDESDPVVSTYTSGISVMRDALNKAYDLLTTADPLMSDAEKRSKFFPAPESPQTKVQEAQADAFVAKSHLYVLNQYWNKLIYNYTPQDTYLGVRKTPEEIQAEKERLAAGTLGDGDQFKGILGEAGLTGTAPGSIYHYLANTWPGTVVTGSVLTAMDTLFVTPYNLTIKVQPNASTPSIGAQAADFLYYGFGYPAKQQPGVSTLIEDRLKFNSLPVERQTQLLATGIELADSGSPRIALSYLDQKMAPLKIGTLESFAKKAYFESFTNPDLTDKQRTEMRYLAFATQQEASQLKVKSVADFSAPYYNLYTALPISILLDPTNLIGLPEGLIARSEGFKTAYEAKQFAQVARTAEQGAATVESFASVVTSATRAADAAANALGPAITNAERLRIYAETYAQAISQSTASKQVERMLAETLVPAGKNIIDPLNPTGSFKDAIASIFQPLAFSKVESAAREAHAYTTLLLNNVRNSVDAKTILKHVFQQTGLPLPVGRLTDPLLHFMADAKGNYPIAAELLGQQTFQELVRVMRPVLDQIELMPSLAGKAFPMDKVLDDIQTLVEKGSAISHGIPTVATGLPVNAVRWEYEFINGEHTVKILDDAGKTLRPERFPTELAAKKYIDDLKKGNYARNKFYDFVNPIVGIQSLFHLSSNPGAILVNGLSGHLQINANYGWKFRDGVADMARVEKFTSGVAPYKDVYDAIAKEQALGRTLKDKILGYRSSINPLGEANSYRLAYSSVFNDAIHSQVDRFLRQLGPELGALPVQVADTIRAYATTGEARLLAETLGNYNNANKAIVSLPAHLREVLPADVYANLLRELSLTEVAKAPSVIDSVIDTQIDLLKDQVSSVPHVTGNGHSFMQMTQDQNIANLLASNGATPVAAQMRSADARFVSFVSANGGTQPDVVYSLWRQVSSMDMSARAQIGDAYTLYAEGSSTLAEYQAAANKVWGERNSKLLGYLNNPTTIPNLPSLPLSAMPAEAYPVLDAAMRQPIVGAKLNSNYPEVINAGRELLEKGYAALLTLGNKMPDKSAFADILLSAKHDNWSLGVHAQKIVDDAFKAFGSLPAHTAYASPMEFRNAVFREMRYLELKRVSEAVDLAELTVKRGELMTQLAYTMPNGTQARLVFTDGPYATISVGTQRFTVPSIDIPLAVRQTYDDVLALNGRAEYRTLEQILAAFPRNPPAPTYFTATIGQGTANTIAVQSLDEPTALLAEKYLRSDGAVLPMQTTATADDILDANRASMEVRHAMQFDVPASDPFPDNQSFSSWLSVQQGQPVHYNGDPWAIQSADLGGVDLISPTGATARARLDEVYFDAMTQKYADVEMRMASLADYKNTTLIPTLQGTKITDLPTPENPNFMQEVAIAHIDSLHDARQLLKASLQRTGTMTGAQIEAIRSAGSRVAEKLSEFASIAHEAAHWAVKDAMIGSAKKYPIDMLLRIAAPYHTFYTRSYYNIFRRMAMQPRYYMTQYKAYEAISKSNEQQGFGGYDGETIVFTTPDGGKHTLPNPLLRLMPIAPMTGQKSYGNDQLGLYQTGLGFHFFINAGLNALNGNIVASTAQYTSQGKLIGDAYQWYTGRPMPGFDADAQYRQTTTVIVEQAKQGKITQGESVAAMAVARSYYQRQPYDPALLTDYPNAEKIFEAAGKEGGKRSFISDATGFLTGFRYNTLSPDKQELATIAQRSRDNKAAIGTPDTYATKSGASQRYRFPGGAAYAAIGSVFNKDYTPPENSAMLDSYHQKLDTLFADMAAAREKAVRDLYAKDKSPKLGDLNSATYDASKEYWTHFEELKKQYAKWAFPPGSIAKYSPEEEGDNKLQEIFSKAGDYAPKPTEAGGWDEWDNGQVDWIYKQYTDGHGKDDAVLFTKDEVKLKWYLFHNRFMSEFEKNLRIEVLKSNAERYGGDLSYIPQREYDRYIQARAGGGLTNDNFDASNYTTSGVPLSGTTSPVMAPVIGTGSGTSSGGSGGGSGGTVDAGSGLRLGKDATGYFAIDSAGVKQYTKKDGKGFYITDSVSGEKVYTQLFSSGDAGSDGPGTLRPGERRDRNGLIIRQFPTYGPRGGGSSGGGGGGSSPSSSGGPLGFDANALYEILRYEGDYAIINYNGKLYRVHKLFLSQLRGFKPDPQRMRSSLLLPGSR